jgi:hypothetical protein
MYLYSDAYLRVMKILDNIKKIGETKLFIILVNCTVIGNIKSNQIVQILQNKC